LYLNNDGIDKVVKEYERDTKALRKDLMTLCWYMRGGMTLSESFLLTPEDRETIGQIVEDNLKMTKESGLPFF
jgi:hypothetical protein